MPERADIHYFGAGPAALPTSVLTTAAAAIQNYESSGLGLIEQSHRSASSTAIITSAASHLLELLSVPTDKYTAIFMQGGGTTQFSAVFYNLLSNWIARKLAENNNDLEAVRELLKTAHADYLITGAWSQKAAAEATRLGGAELINVAADARKLPGGKFGDIPKQDAWTLTPAERNIYTFYCDNETIDGVEFPGFPEALKDGRNVVADMSSNILSRELDISNYAVIFAGAQKNVGGAGVTLVVVRNDILAVQASDEAMRKLGFGVPPVMMMYPILGKNGSLYNTLPVFDVFICREVMAGLLARGGLAAQEKVAGRKAKQLYDALENEAYEVVPAPGARSRMNIVFRLKAGEEAQKEFLKGAEERGLLGLKGHRSVGGLRISNYNSITEEGAEKLAAWIKEFAERK